MSHTIEEVSHSKILHSPSFHLLLAALLLFDGLICLACGVLDAAYLSSERNDCKEYVESCLSGHRRLATSSSPNLAGVDSSAQRRLGGQGSPSDPPCAGHPHFGNHTYHDVEKVLTYISMTILIFFLLEQLVLIYELRFDYCKPMFILDFLMIVSALLIEILATNLTVAGLIVLVRVWRFARCGHSALVAYEHTAEGFVGDSHLQDMEAAISQISDARWQEFLTTDSRAAELKDSFSAHEMQVVARMMESPAIILRALAVAKTLGQIKVSRNCPPTKQASVTPA